VEVSERLVGSPAFKAGGTGDPRPAGSIPVHLRHSGPTGEVHANENAGGTLPGVASRRRSRHIDPTLSSRSTRR